MRNPGLLAVRTPPGSTQNGDMTGSGEQAPTRRSLGAEAVEPRGAATAEFTDTSAEGGSESTLTVLLALAANLGIGLLKLVAGLLTGSGALLSEAAH
ncbi:MAG: hypothetical protein QOE23_2868, partial [Pseudonocardiales bacterium]|nr:hypothetical protein [Pseudonocardiales bacterium]